ncbi:uncharacterized protein LOC102808491 [Saccoglossus kowalevskii]|uniref:Uncharacterized protein LOC102808491 n=1 Tax=Saccoglossus kowalevskii TaxID=10224 RepID=A0ABM0N0I9_SACKO|nr:PREDICTED: uncharacterized protein LOC102808491 [Saccoglossus kowalevskii]
MADSRRTAARKLADDFWEWRIKESPEFATMAGFHDYDDQLDDHSLDSFERRQTDCRSFLSRINDVMNGTQNAEDEMNMLILKSDIKMYLEGMRYKGYLYPVNFLEGPHLDFEKTVSYMKFNTLADYEKLTSRLEKFPTQMDQIISLLKQGIKEKRTNNQYSMNGVISQLDDILKVDAKDSGFYEPFSKLSDVATIDEQRKQQLESHGLSLIKENVMNSFVKLRTFLSQEYMKHLRPEIGCSTLPDGKEHYAQVLKFHITCDLTPQRVHDIGIEEVTRIRQNMDKVIKKVGFEGNFNDFLEFLKSDEQFYYKNKDELMAGYSDIVNNKIRPLLPRLFQNIPHLALELKATPEKEKNSPAAYYYAPSEDGSRPGTFYVNCNNVTNQPKYEMIALSLHEGEPGHHLQGAYSLEMRDMPGFRRFLEDRHYYEPPSRFGMNTAFIEGWGLYSEYLGEELGLYEDDPYSLFGRYSMEILRACRLVVDTGMHYMGWSRDKAVDYMDENTAMAKHNVRTEIDRYITWPGQACAYKIGELKIKELREKAQKELGERFDVRDFHEAFLSCGFVSISVLEQVIDDYIKKTKE